MWRWAVLLALLTAAPGGNAAAQRLLILPPHVESAGLSHLRASLPEMLASRLSAEGIRAKVSSGSAGSPRDAASAQGIPWALSGALRLHEGRVILELHLVRARDGKRLSLSLEALPEQLIERLREVAARVAHLLAAEEVPPPPQGPPPSGGQPLPEAEGAANGVS